MPSTTLVHTIHDVGHALMLLGATVTGNATAEIINNTGEPLTISVPSGLPHLVRVLVEKVDDMPLPGIVGHVIGPYVAGPCVITLDEATATALFDALGECWG